MDLLMLGLSLQNHHDKMRLSQGRH